MKREELTADHVLKRSQMEIIAEILEIHTNPTPKPRKMRRASMSNTNLHIFVNQLLRSKLLKSNGHFKEFITTEKGLEFIKKFRALQKLLKS